MVQWEHLGIPWLLSWKPLIECSQNFMRLNFKGLILQIQTDYGPLSEQTLQGDEMRAITLTRGLKRRPLWAVLSLLIGGL